MRWRRRRLTSRRSNLERAAATFRTRAFPSRRRAAADRSGDPPVDPPPELSWFKQFVSWLNASLFPGSCDWQSARCATRSRRTLAFVRLRVRVDAAGRLAAYVRFQQRDGGRSGIPVVAALVDQRRS
jgi:hypothetical protein